MKSCRLTNKLVYKSTMQTLERRRGRGGTIYSKIEGDIDHETVESLFSSLRITQTGVNGI